MPSLNVCSMATANGAVVTLTAKNGRGVFSGWSSACAGTNPVCTVTVDDAKTTTATFLTPCKLTPRTTGVGTLTFLSGTAVQTFTGRLRR